MGLNPISFSFRLKKMEASSFAPASTFALDNSMMYDAPLFLFFNSESVDISSSRSIPRPVGWCVRGRSSDMSLYLCVCVYVTTTLLRKGGTES